MTTDWSSEIPGQNDLKIACARVITMSKLTLVLAEVNEPSYSFSSHQYWITTDEVDDISMIEDDVEYLCIEFKIPLVVTESQIPATVTHLYVDDIFGVQVPKTVKHLFIKGYTEIATKQPITLPDVENIYIEGYLPGIDTSKYHRFSQHGECDYDAQIDMGTRHLYVKYQCDMVITDTMFLRLLETSKHNASANECINDLYSTLSKKANKGQLVNGMKISQPIPLGLQAQKFLECCRKRIHTAHLAVELNAEALVFRVSIDQ